MRGRTLNAKTVDRLVQDEERKHRQWLNEALEKIGLEQEKIQIHFHKGDAKHLARFAHRFE